VARLFAQDYHTHSSTWFFNHAVIPLHKGELLYWKSRDEQHIHLHFFPVRQRLEVFSAYVDIVYDPASAMVMAHSCAECKDDPGCRHYLSILRYAYHYLSTDILQDESVETYFGEILSGGEHWLEIVQQAHIAVEGIYEPEADKIRFHLDEFLPMDVKALIQYLVTSPEEAAAESEEDRKQQAKVFTDADIMLLQWLHKHRISFNPRSHYYTIYKSGFASALALMQNSSCRFTVKETGEALIFGGQHPDFTIRISPLGKDEYSVHPVLTSELSAWYYGQPLWLFFRNHVHTVHLPFNQVTAEKLFSFDWRAGLRDLVYLRTIVHKLILNTGVYLDFTEDISFPVIYADPPHLKLSLSPLSDDVAMQGNLTFAGEAEIPLSVLRFRSTLINSAYRSAGSEDAGDPLPTAWFHIPPFVFARVDVLLNRFPNVNLERLEQHSQIIFSGAEEKEILKSAILDLSETEWEIEIAPELRRDFVYKVHLSVQIKAKQADEIDWFEYSVVYHYKDFSFSHDELASYFRSGEPFLHTEDGRLVMITNPSVYEDIDLVIRRSELRKDKIYRSRLMNLPYYQRLKEDNPDIAFGNDATLQRMAEALVLRRHSEASHLPIYLQTVLRGYQKAGISWIMMLRDFRLNGLLADEMGLGKTIQALSVIAVSTSERPNLVICPKTLLFNWAAEIEKFHTEISHCIVEGSAYQRKELYNKPNIKLFIVSYSVVLNDIKTLMDKRFEWIIMDEAQHVKNIRAKRTLAIKKLKSEHRLALTGTPMENNFSELWSIFDFLMPDYLGSIKRFTDDYINPPDPEQNSLRLSRMTAPFIMRRMKRDVLLELPDKQEQISWCKLTSIQEKTYLQILDMVKKTLFPTTNAPVNYINILAALTKLRQVCDHPALVNSDILSGVEVSAKLEQLVELVEDALQSNHKVLVFSQFVQMLRIIRTTFDQLGITYSYMDGQSRDRKAQVDRFNNDPGVSCFLISLKTGGTGLNLTAADTVILYDPWWNPMIENQAIDRTHRIGQTSKVQVFRLITKGTVEEKILALQQGKLEIFRTVIDHGQQLLKQLTTSDIRSLFTLDLS